MVLMVIGLLLFVGMHSVSIIAEDFRNRLVARSELAWKAGYGLVSLVGFVLICIGYANARLDPMLLYVPPLWLRHVAALLLLPVFILFVASYLPGRIKTATKHPQLVAVKLWAFAHLLVNGTLADVVLFGSLLAWAVADRISLKRRAPRAIPTAPESGFNDAIAVVVGLAVYGVFAVWLHYLLIGVAPFG